MPPQQIDIFEDYPICRKRSQRRNGNIPRKRPLKIQRIRTERVQMYPLYPYRNKSGAAPNPHEIALEMGNEVARGADQIIENILQTNMQKSSQIARVARAK
jgi:hypothetical protein